MIRFPLTSWILAGMCGCCFGVGVAYSADDVRTIDQIRMEVIKSQSSQPPSDGIATRGVPSSQPEQAIDASRSVGCPSPIAVDFFRHEVAYERTEELNPLRGLALISTRIWERGPLTAFYVDAALRTFLPSIRLVYFVGADGARGSFSCPVEENWQKCVQKSAGLEAVNNVARTCTITLDLRTVPPWRPSPNDETKRRIADELRNEIENQWQGVEHIVIRDFNLKDRQINIYLRMADGDYFQGCGFRAQREPHCEGWHLFGQVPISKIRNWIFERPYHLK